MRYIGGGQPGLHRKPAWAGTQAALNEGQLPAQVPFLVFNRKDDMQRQWVTQAFGIRAPRLNERFVPSSEAYVRAVRLGWGIGVAPELQVRDLLQRGELTALRPEVTVDVRLYWHQWMLGDVAPAAAGAAPQGAATLQRVGQALAAGAAQALGAAQPSRVPRRGGAVAGSARAAVATSPIVARAEREPKG